MWFLKLCGAWKVPGPGVVVSLFAEAIFPTVFVSPSTFCETPLLICYGIYCDMGEWGVS